MKTNKLNKQQLGKVGVLFGGNSSERAVSLRSGQAVLAGLQQVGIDAVGIDVQFDKHIIQQLQGIDCAFIALHGRGGEDGTMQAILNLLKIPYTGSGVMASALAMDKLRTKQLWQGAGLASPEFVAVSSKDQLSGVLEAMGGVAMVKPPHEGSSIGMSRVTNQDQLEQAFELASQHDDEVLVERWITGEEYTCAIVDGQALPVVCLQTDHAFYDFQAKYESNDTRYLCPCGLDSATEAKLQALSLQAFNVLGCKGWGRVDVMRDTQGDFWLLEVNTVPGMTDHSLVPMAAKQRGMSFSDLVAAILLTAQREPC